MTRNNTLNKTFRNICNINKESLINDLITATSILYYETTDTKILDYETTAYNLNNTLNLQLKSPWYTSDLHELKLKFR